MSHFLQDLRYAVRQLAQARSATIIVVLTLALGIGANTSMFTLVNALLFKPAPAADPDRLAWLSMTDRQGRAGSFANRSLSYPDYLSYRDGLASFDGLMAWNQVSLSLGGSAPERINGAVVTGNFFSVLGIVPAQGRTFAANEDVVPGLKPVVVIGHALWTRRFGASPRMVDSTIIVNGHVFTVIGIAPQGFGGIELDDPTELWVPTAMLSVAMPEALGLRDDANAGWLQTIGRLKPGVTLSQADAEAKVVAKRLAARSANKEDAKYAVVSAVIGGLPASNRGEVVPIMALVSLVPLLVLLVACANAANVQLARMLARRKELAVRRALGASRARLFRQLLTEAMLLSLLAGGCGVLLSFWLTSLILRVSDAPLFLATLAPDVRVLAATTAIAMVSGLVFGIAPALTASKPQVGSALKDDGITIVMGGGRHRLRSALVVAQVAVSLLLIVTAGLFVRSLDKSLRVDPGFDAHRLAAVTFDLGILGYSPDASAAFERRLLDEVQALPGVQSAALSNVLPLSGRMWGTDVRAEGAATEGRGQSSGYTMVSSGYLATMGVKVTRGRDFSASDNAASPRVAIINERLAQRLWPGGDALGKRFRLGGPGEPLREVIGMTRTGKYDSLNESEAAFFYLPQTQQSSPLQGSRSLVVRASTDPASLLAPLSRLFRTLDPNLPLYRLETYEQSLARVVDKQRAASSMLGVFGALALLLASIGMYGVTAHGVSLRTREIGIRMSLGARAGDVLALFVREGLALSLVGVVIGLAASAAASKLLAEFLFGLSATDSLTFVAGATVLCAVAAIASFLPARRAAHVDPMVALRYD